MTSQEIGKLMEALAKAQAEIKAAKEDSTNPFFKSKYADLGSVWNACREPLTKNGLAVSQVLELTERGQALRTILGHSSGEWLDSLLLFPTDIKDPQAMGKIITYYRRYALAAITGVCPGDDDDAEGVMQPYRTEQTKKEVEKIVTSNYVNSSQCKQIDEMIGDDKQYKERLLAFYKVSSFDKLEISKLPKLLEAIKKHNEERLDEELKNQELPF